MEMEKLESQLAVLENDRLSLKRELAALQEEIQNRHKDVESDAQEPKKQHRQLVESLRQKNKHLSSLLNDVEASEKENIVLREKLTNIKIELSEATKSIMHTTGEIVTLQITKEEQAEKVRYLEQMCEALRHQVTELVQEKEKRDSELETFQMEIDIRVEEWKKIVATKEKELSDLRDQLAHQSVKGQYIMKSCESDQIVLLSQTLQKRELQIDELQAQLSQATKDLNETTSLLENMHRSSELSQVDPHIQVAEVSQKQLLAAEDKIKMLEEKLRNAEEDADGKSEEITKMIIQLRSYEAGEFGLTEALAQIKELSQQRMVRDKHIEQLVETANQLQNTYDSLQEENLTLREQLHISPEDHVKTSTKVLKTKEENIVKVHQQQIDRLEEDLISAKMDRRALTQQVLALSKQLQGLENQPPEVQRTSNKQQIRSQADARAAARKIRALQQEQHQSSIERQSLVEENEALRQGLHDILDSVHNQDGQSNVRLESKVLEHLLHALDSRHISGWYHPAMRIQAKVNAVEGNNEALREQLHSMREEESRTQNELHKAKLRIAELEEISKDPLNKKEVFSSDTKTSGFQLPAELSSHGLDVISKMNKHLLQVLHELELDKTQVSETLNVHKELQLQLEELVSQLAHAVQQHNVDKENWVEEKSGFVEQLDLMQANLAASDAKVFHLTALLDKFSDQDDVKKEMVKDFLECAALRADKQRCERMAKAAQHWAENAKAQVRIIKSEWNASKQWILKNFGDLLQFKKNSLSQLSELEAMLANSVPLSSLKAANKHADESTAKYEDLLRRHEILVNKTDQEVQKLVSELELERKMRHDLVKQFESLNQKFWAKNLPNDASVQELGVQLSGVEGEVLREKQLAYHAEKMCDIVKEEVKQVSKRCCALEEEVMTLLDANQKLKLELSKESSLAPVHLNEKSDVEIELATKKAEVLELQASRKHLQELANISQAQVQMLDQLHQRSELQLDSLRQVLYKLQGETDLGFEIARLGEELCAAQISESAAWNQISSLERQRNEALSSCEKQAKEIEELESKLSTEKLQYVQQCKKMQEKMVAANEGSEHNLPLSFFNLVVRAFAQRSEECRTLWKDLQVAKEELVSLTLVAEEKKVSCQQTLELQNALLASHSDVDCQRRMESWANALTDFKIKDLKSSRLCDVMKATLKQTEERLESQETLLSSIEQQLLFLDIRKVPASTDQDFGRAPSQDTQKVTPINKTVDMPLDVEANLKSNPIETRVESPPSPAKPPPTDAMVRKESQDNEVLLKEQIVFLKEEIKNLTALLRETETELGSYRKTCSDLQQSLHKENTSLQTSNQDPPTAKSPPKDAVEAEETEKNDCIVPIYDKVALQATVESLQNIIMQKENTISRYQKFLGDVREEDARIISALQEHLRVQQAELTAQEQAYVRLKISTRHLTLEANADINSKTCLDSHLARTNELEDDVALLKAKVSSLLTEVQNKQQDASYWSSVAQQHLSTIEDLNIKLSEQKSSDKRSSFCLPVHDTSSKSTNLLPPNKVEQDKQEFKGFKNIDRLSKFKSNQVQMQINTELADLRNKILQMEEQERHYKNEIQRLKDQIPIYSRRAQQILSGPLRPEREEELLKKIGCLEQQLEHQKTEHEKILAQRVQLETKKIKSVENVARWDERKKHQLQIDRLKNSLHEHTEESVLLHDKVERLHGRVHRLEREKQALEHQIRNLHHVQQDKALLEGQLKKMESSRISQCMLDELQRERDKLCAEVQILKAKDAMRGHRCKDECHSDNVQKERAELLKANLELECENLEMKLELEKLQSETMCLRHKVSHLERLLLDTHGQRTLGTLPDGTQDLLVTENKILQQKVQQLVQQLDSTNHHLRTLENNKDNGRITALQTELDQKCELLRKVKTLLERAAIKERQLSEQVYKLEAKIAKK
ncbi:centrosomal protein of 290 kDa-like isoform X2 [Thrips palmi]|nr:centrosomal protein of 290 kDa-like isoform X2 [Thrips palmi]XP_034245101.1 centrosomal protein of 290 kDa-like isoform X2 [Thrips palmi]